MARQVDWRFFSDEDLSERFAQPRILKGKSQLERAFGQKR